MPAVRAPTSVAAKQLFVGGGHRLLLLAFLFMASSSSSELERVTTGSATVKSLPGFEGELPFVLETGYIGVGDSEDVQLFYYFVKSESDPGEDPLILWLTGGPGCSSFTAFIDEFGPLVFDTSKKDDRTFPTLVLNPNSWSKVANIIFLDFPVGTGFSYGTTPSASHSTDFQACDQAYQFLRKWLIDHPEFLSNTFYMGGDSYAGIPVPIITQLISNGNEEGMKPLINLKGYVLGNPVTNQDAEIIYQVQFAHGVGFISDELYESLQSCQGKKSDIHPSTIQCGQYREAYDQCVKGINTNHILEPDCPNFFTKPQLLNRIRSWDVNDLELLPPKSSPCESAYIVDEFAQNWLNDDTVQEALHIRKGSVGKWTRCRTDDLPYTVTTMNSVSFHVNLSTKGFRSLIYSGDHDMLVTHFGTQAWIRSLNYPIVDEWRSWTVQGQVAGYTRTYSNRMTFATVKGGGHTAPTQRGLECWAMFRRWIAHEPL